MARTTVHLFIAALLAAFIFACASPSLAPAAAAPGAVHADIEQTDPHPYAGSDGRSPLDDVPVVPMVGATAAILAVLSVIAFRRGWI